MINFSRRLLARYAVDELAAKTSASKLSKKLAAALLASRRSKEADLLMADIEHELEERGLQTNALATSAHQLTPKLRKELSARLKKLTGTKEVVLQEQVDADVIGGVRLETSGRSWDSTIKKRLNDIREA